MNRFDYNEVAEFAEEKRKLLEWITLWQSFEPEKTENISVDVTELSVLAQLMDYKLESFQTLSHLQNIKDEVKIEITCYKSGVRSVLKKQSNTCSCPSEDALENGQFWNVIGIGPSTSPSTQTSISTSTSSLLPKVSNTMTKMIKGLLKMIVGLIKNAEDVENDARTPEPLFTRHNSLDIVKRKAGVVRLKRTNSFDVTSKHTPLLHTSTPDGGQSNRMKNIECSKCGILTNNLISINKIINESLEVVSVEEANKTFTSKPNMSRKISDIKPTEGPSVKYLREINEIRSSVKKETPKFRTVVRKCDTPTFTHKEYYGHRPPCNSAAKGTIKTGTTGIARIIKTAKPTETPNTRLPKRKL